jgi:hypothetical protein
MSKIDDLAKLSALRSSGALSDAEFTALKADIMAKPEDGNQAPATADDITGGAANSLVALLWVKFIVGAVIAVIGIIFFFSKFGSAFLR